VERPNILLCLADDAGMHMGAYGCNWVSTPGFDRVALHCENGAQQVTVSAEVVLSKGFVPAGVNVLPQDHEAVDTLGKEG